MINSEALNQLVIIVNTAVSLAALWFTICALNVMTPRTRAAIRLAYILIGIGVAGSLLAPFFHARPPTWPEVVLIAGVCVLSIYDRRRKVQRLLMRG